MKPPARLAELQAWMMRAIAAGEAGDDWVLPSQQQSAGERLGVYHHAYLARLQDCLREQFPVLTAALGREAFDQFAAEYVQRHPPASYTLNHLADRFVEHLQSTRPLDVPSPGWPDFLIDLARLERTVDEVFDGPGVENLRPIDVGELTWLSPEELRLTPAPCLRLLALAFPVDDYYTAAKGGESPRWPEPAPSWLAITRREYVVRRIPLERAEFQVLHALASGQPLGQALDACEESSPEQVREWFAAWGRLRLFSSARS